MFGEKNSIPTISPLTMLMMMSAKLLAPSKLARAKLNFIIQKQLFSRFSSPSSSEHLFTWLEAQIEQYLPAFQIVHLIVWHSRKHNLKGFKHKQVNDNKKNHRLLSHALTFIASLHLLVSVFSGTHTYNDKHRKSGRCD